jgi:HSP20 family protein
MARNPLSLFPFGGIQGDFTDPVLALYREMNRVFGDAAQGRLPPPQKDPAGQHAFLVPHLDVSETDKEIHIRAELPGVKAEDVHLTLHDDLLTIEGEKEVERKDDTERFHVVERSYGSFQRSIRIPHRLQPEDVKAHLDHGVLIVTLPKPTVPASRSRIEVKHPGVSVPTPEAKKAAQSVPPTITKDKPPASDKSGEASANARAPRPGTATLTEGETQAKPKNKKPK